MRLGFQPERAFARRERRSRRVRRGARPDVVRHRRTSVDRIAASSTPRSARSISGIVGSYETTRQAVQLDSRTALLVLALISLSLGIINLFPFLPLDGGHVFWAVAEKIRGKADPVQRHGAGRLRRLRPGDVLFVIGLTNDIDTPGGRGFDLIR